MTDRAFDPPADDPFAQIAQTPAVGLAGDKDPSNDNDPFAAIAQSGGTDASSKLGAFARGAERSVIPALGSFPAIGAGAEAGGALGAAIGGPAAPITAPVGALVGGVAGALLGSTAISSAQNWLLSKAPDSWKEKIGLDDRQEQLDQTAHPYASFLGGLAPYALTMRPGFGAAAKLPDNATALKRIMSHPVTARVFGGAAMGGMELGNEAASNEDLDWRKVAISTGFGLVFNKPTKIGEALTEVGARPARSLLGRPEPTVSPTVAPPVAPEETAATTAGAPTTAREWNETILGQRPTVAQAGDLGVAGPGLTESTFQGGNEASPSATMAAQENARTEQSVIGEPPVPDVHDVARRMHPDLFAQYDDLVARQDAFRKWIADYNEPPPEALQELEGQRDTLQAQLDAHVAEQNGYTGGKDARRLRAQIRDVEGQRQDMLTRAEQFKAGTAEETADLAAARQHLMATDYELRDLQPQVQAAYRRAADATGGQVVEPEVSRETPIAVAPAVPQVAPEAPAAPGAETAPQTAVAPKELFPIKPIADQKTFIAQDVAQKLIAAGRPADEAEASGKLLAERYATRAARFNGALGTAEELYRNTSAEIRGERQPPPSIPVPSVVPEAPLAPAGAEEPIPAPRKPGGPSSRPMEKWSLLQFLAHAGGLKRNAEVDTIFGGKNPFIPGFGRLIRKDGMTLDRAREAAVEGRYFHDAGAEKGTVTESTIEELLSAMDAEARGKRQYQLGNAPPEKTVDADEERHRMGDALDTGLEELGLKPADVTGDTRERVLEIMSREGVSDPLKAYEQAVMEEDNRGISSGELEPRTTAIPGWDVPDERGAAPRARGAVEGARPETGETARELGESHELAGEEFFQRKRSLVAEREAEGQLGLPGAERISDAELAQRRSDEALKPKVAQKPLDVGLFGDEKDQKNLFQAARAKIRIAEGKRPIITLMKDANASSFLHETGHQWLEELLADAEHPQAPDAIKDDADTVLNWLGAHSADDIKTKHHEKFARGFEQYMREGTAPSPELAGVFAKFKQWLMNIYQTIKGLGKPINEDIRGVFDRMLAEEPQRTVIAPETAVRPTLADIHEADAALTEPHEADAAMARVEQEAQRAYDDHPEQQLEIETKLAASTEPAGEVGAGTGELPKVQPSGEPAGAKPAGGGSGEEHGEEREGGGAAGAEGAGVSRPEQRPDSGTGPDANPLAANPARTLDRGDTRAVDKAGNIRVENITSIAGLAQAIHESAERNGEFKSVRGEMTQGQVVDLANDLNLDPATIDENQLGQLFGGMDQLAPKIWALRKLLRDSAQVVFDAMRQVGETNSDADAAAFAVAAARHDMIQGVVSKVTAETGRALGMGFRNLEGWEKAENLSEFLKANTGRTLFQLKQMAKMGASLDTPAKVSKFLRDAQKRSFWGMVLEYWINGLISGIATHVTYTVGNGALGANRMLLETPAAAIIGKIREQMGEEGAHVQPGEVGARLSGLYHGLPAAVQASLEAVRSGVTTLLPGETGRAMMPFAGDAQITVGKNATNEPVTWGEVRGDMAGMIRGLRDGIQATAELVKAGGEEGSPFIGLNYSPLGQIPDVAIRGVTALPLGTAVRIPSRMIAAIHSFFRSANYSMEKAADAYRTASAEGLEGEAFDSRVGQIWTDPDEARMAKYRQQSTEMTLMGQGSKFTQALSKLTNVTVGNSGFRPLKFVDPFVHIASNVIDQSIIKRTPIGLLSPELRADLMGRPDPLTGRIDIAARDMAQARMLVGSALGITFAGLAAQGYISGSGPKDPKESAMWRLAGNQAHSVRIGETWYDLHRLGPLGMLLGISADMYDVAHTATHEDMVTAAAHLQHAIVQNILDESFMRGPASLIQAIEDPERYGQQYIENTLSSFVPFSVGMAQMARASDPYSRRARSVMDSIRNKVPSLSETLYPRRDIWGEPIPNLPALGGRGLTAFYEQKMSHDPVNQAMLQLGISPAPVERKIRNVELTDGQYDDFSRLAGRMTKMRLDAIVNSPDYQGWPNNIRSTVINEVIRQSREAARGLLMMKSPDIVAAATKSQIDRKMGNDTKTAQKRFEMSQ